MSYDPKAIANYLLELGKKDHISLSPMKMQKLIYYANGWHLAITGQPLIDEQVEAWTFGPVIKSIYHEFREFGNQPITRPATDIICREDPAEEDGYYIKRSIPSVEDDATRAAFTKLLLDKVWTLYGNYTAIQLSNMTHELGSPWHQIVTKYQGKWPKGTDIPIETIRDHFLGLMAGGKPQS